MTTTSDSFNEIILLSLDCLLETHLGTCAIIDSKAPLEILKSGYRNRDCNDLWEFTDLITEEEFIDRWQKRDIDTLKASVIRNVIGYIKSMIHIKTLDCLDRGGSYEVKVIINGFPYGINDELKRDMGNVLQINLSNLCKIEFISLDIGDITPKYLRNKKITSFFLNDFKDWFDIHYLNLNETPYPSLSVYAPAISKDLMKRVQKGLMEGVLNEEFMKQINPFRAGEIALAEHLSLNYLSVDIFSIPKL